MKLKFNIRFFLIIFITPSLALGQGTPDRSIYPVAIQSILEKADRTIIIHAESSLFEVPRQVAALDVDLFPSNAISIIQSNDSLIIPATREIYQFKQQGITQEVPVGTPLLTVHSQAFANIFLSQRLERIERIFTPVSESQLGLVNMAENDKDMSRYFRLILQDGSNRAGIIDQLRSIPGVINVAEEITFESATSRANTPVVPPNDTYYDSKQWYIKPKNTQNQFSMNAENSWLLMNDDASGVKVFVLDFWDHNFYLLRPDKHSNFGSHTDYVLNLTGNYPKTEMYPNGYSNHNVEVAGTVSARVNDATGIAGAAYNAKLMMATWTTLSWASNELVSAVNQGASVVNLSFGYGYAQSNFLFENAIDFAYDSRKAFIVGATPNDIADQSANPFPHSLPKVFGVNATTRGGGLQSGGVSDPAVRISAPGDEIWAPTIQNYVASGHEQVGGTSFAAPLVAGTVANLQTIYPYLRLDPAQIKSILESTADDQGPSGYDTVYGNGILDAYEAGLAALRLDPNSEVFDNTQYYGGLTFNGLYGYVPLGATLTLAGTTILGNSNNFSSTLIVLGKLVIPSGAVVNGDPGAEIVSRGGGEVENNGIINVDQVGSCVMAERNSTIRFKTGSSATVSNGGFLASKGGSYIIEDGVTITSAATAGDLHLHSGSTFSLGNGSEMRIAIDDSRPQTVIGTDTAPITFTGGKLIIDDANVMLAHVDLSSTALQATNSAEVDVRLAGGGFRLEPGSRVDLGSRLSIGPGTIPPPLGRSIDENPAVQIAQDGANLQAGTRAASLGSGSSSQSASAAQHARSASNQAESLPEQFALKAPYPNPFNGSTTIPYALPEQSKVALDVYNMVGQRVARLYEGTQEPGHHTATWAPANLPSGVYLVRLQTATFQQVQRVALTK